MYSLNQVNKLVSCGRDQARSLPFWRGFLLLPLILVWLAFAPNAQTTPAPQTPDPGAVGGQFNTADGTNALFNVTGFANAAFGWFSLIGNTSGSFNTGAGAGTLLANNADANTAVGAAALLFNGAGGENTAVGAAAMVNNAGDATTFDGFFNDAVGAFALTGNVAGFSNNAVGNSALFFNINGAQNTAIGDLALDSNDADGAGVANNNTAVGASCLTANFSGSENTAVGTGVGPNIVTGFNNTYVGNFIDPGVDESSTIRINDLSGGDAQACFIGGIFNNFQPVNGTNIVQVTIDLSDDHLGWDLGPNQGGRAPAVPQRGVPQRRARPQAGNRQAMLNDKVEKLQATVAQQQTTVAQQQKQIETLTAQLREQAAQIQNVSAQLEMVRPAPRVVENR